MFFGDVLLACSKKYIAKKLKLTTDQYHIVNIPKDHRTNEAWNKKFKPFKHVEADRNYTIKQAFAIQLIMNAYRLKKVKKILTKKE